MTWASSSIEINLEVQVLVGNANHGSVLFPTILSDVVCIPLGFVSIYVV